MVSSFDSSQRRPIQSINQSIIQSINLRLSSRSLALKSASKSREFCLWAYRQDDPLFPLPHCSSGINIRENRDECLSEAENWGNESLQNRIFIHLNTHLKKSLCRSIRWSLGWYISQDATPFPSSRDWCYRIYGDIFSRVHATLEFTVGPSVRPSVGYAVRIHTKRWSILRHCPCQTVHGWCSRMHSPV